MSDTQIANCTGCRFFKTIPMARGAGMCRRYPPSTAIVGLDQFKNPAQMTFFPQANSETWCGEFVAIFEPPVLGMVSHIETKGSA